MDYSRTKDQLIRHEGVRLKPYLDTVGKLTIGIGRNLDDVGITQDEAELMLHSDIALVLAGLDKEWPWWVKLNGARQGVLINMAFNLGIAGLGKFKQTIRLVELGVVEKDEDWFAKAGEEMLKSKWADQVGNRAIELSVQMSVGQWPDSSRFK